MPKLTFDDRVQLRSILVTIDDIELSTHTAVRTYRNALLVATATLITLAILFPFVAAQISPQTVAIRFVPPGQPPTALSLTSAMASVEIWGLLGATIAAITVLFRLRSFSSAAGLQFAQLILKLPAGALTALFGIVLLQSEIVPPLSAVSDAKLAAYAIIFGFAQEAVTHLVDRRASDLLLKAEPLDRDAGS
jgi:hypothetical protein